jgi:hypothetical protein
MRGLLLLGLSLLGCGTASAQDRCTSSAPQIVDDVYKQVLERPADRDSAVFSDALASGRMTVREVVGEVAKSREHLERFFWRPVVVTVYRQMLQRDPSSQEMRAASSDLASGAATLDGFVAHTATRAANNEQEAVRILYRRLLGREPDADGLRSSTQMAQQQGIEAVAQTIINSGEYRQRAAQGGTATVNLAAYENGVALLYQHLLGRNPDRDGQQALTQLAAVYGLGAVVDRIVSSSEYSQRFGEDAVPGGRAVAFCSPERVPRQAIPRRRW